VVGVSRSGSSTAKFDRDRRSLEDFGVLATETRVVDGGFGGEVEIGRTAEASRTGFRRGVHSDGTGTCTEFEEWDKRIEVDVTRRTLSPEEVNNA